MAILTSVDYYIKRKGTGSYSVYVTLYSILSQDGIYLQVSEPLAVSEKSSLDIGTSYAWVSFPFNYELYNDEGWGYIVMLSAPSGNSNNHIQPPALGTTGEETYWQGIRSNDGGATFFIAEDYALRIYIDDELTYYNNNTNVVFDSYVYGNVQKGAGFLNPFPEKPINPTPANATTDVTLDQATITWEDGGGATSYDVYYGENEEGLTLVSEGQAGTSFTITGITYGSLFDYLTSRSWRIDAVNEIGTTTGDVWTFTTIVLQPPLPDGLSLDSGGGNEGTGTTGTASGLNNMITIKRLVVAMDNRLFYEDI